MSESTTLRWPRAYDSVPKRRPIPDQETRKEARRRRYLDKRDRNAFDAWVSQRCKRCSQVRGHVNHEPDPATSIEGPDYYADFLHELHEFEEGAA